jgi:hypothetical protein
MQLDPLSVKHKEDAIVPKLVEVIAWGDATK